MLVFVGPYEGVIEFVKDMPSQCERTLYSRLWAMVDELEYGHPNLPGLVYDDMDNSVPEGCTHLDALMASVTLRLYANNPKLPI